MKVYMFYAKVPNEEFQDLAIKINDKYKYSLSKDGKYHVGLYAWTLKKKVAKDFLEFRDVKGLYFTKNIELDEEEEFEKFKRSYSENELGYFEYTKGKETVKILSTKNEYNIVQDKDMYINDYLSEITIYPVSIFKGETYKLLCALNYDYYSILLHGDEYDIDEVCNNASYGLTPDGSRLLNVFEQNEAMALMSLFRYMIIGDNK